MEAICKEKKKAIRENGMRITERQRNKKRKDKHYSLPEIDRHCCWKCAIAYNRCWLIDAVAGSERQVGNSSLYSAWLCLCVRVPWRWENGIMNEGCKLLSCKRIVFFMSLIMFFTFFSVFFCFLSHSFEFFFCCVLLRALMLIAVVCPFSVNSTPKAWSDAWIQLEAASVMMLNQCRRWEKKQKAKKKCLRIFFSFLCLTLARASGWQVEVILRNRFCVDGS